MGLGVRDEILEATGMLNVGADRPAPELGHLENSVPGTFYPSVPSQTLSLTTLTLYNHNTLFSSS